MKKSELKSLIKPIIEECIRDILLKEGMLSTIISEVMIGVSKQQPIIENNTQPIPLNQASVKLDELHENKKKLLNEIGRDAFGGVNIFEGTTPAPAPRAQGNKYGAMKDMDPSDPGINIDGLSNVMGNTWKALMKGK
tara:strand:- start:1050 stop:1460 length:411 start_codon:yes stop_codon:yes gene_type:complete